MVATSARATIRETGEGGAIAVRVPFDHDLVGELKSELPAFCRRWDAAEQCRHS